MKVPVSCAQCVDEAGLGGRYPIVLMELQDDLVHPMECPRGHLSVDILAATRHDILFESACIAHLCGLHKEAVSSFNTALERFYESCTKAMLRAGGATEDNIAVMWKDISEQSERQAGAFFSLYLLTTSEPFPSRPYKLQERAKFRNQVIHKGRIPTGVEARDFGQFVGALIASTNTALRAVSATSNALDDSKEAALAEAVKRVARERPHSRVTELSMPLVLPSIVDHGATLDDALGALRGRIGLHLSDLVSSTPGSST